MMVELARKLRKENFVHPGKIASITGLSENYLAQPGIPLKSEQQECTPTSLTVKKSSGGIKNSYSRFLLSHSLQFLAGGNKGEIQGRPVKGTGDLKESPL
jgi:hypothetical protein